MIEFISESRWEEPEDEEDPEFFDLSQPDPDSLYDAYVDSSLEISDRFYPR